MSKLNIIDAMQQQDRLLDAQMKAKMVELCFQAFIDPEDFEKRFKQLSQEQQDTTKQEFAKFVDDLAGNKNAQKVHTSTASPLST